MAGSTVTPTQSDSRVLRSPLFRVRSRWAGGSGEVVFVRETRTHVGHVPGRDYSICSLAFTAEGVRSIKLGLTRHSAHLFLWDWKTIVHSSTAVNKIPDSRIIFLVSSFGGSPRIRSNTSVLTRVHSSTAVNKNPDSGMTRTLPRVKNSSTEEHTGCSKVRWTSPRHTQVELRGTQ
ncbi:uncharacterized protein LOC106504335 isoform X2 [Sus scrofa]|uniref:uncharacterized protein LOC106504335 isoform X2 n=1 Tax=Sus scrofa TaxID=9823 RepID=UPI000A2B1544|nr:uncharacterized protein LOC106504335 isoform X2 [Sus scrofa]